MPMANKKSFGLIALLFVVAIYSCGEQTDDSSKTYGPVGPTKNGYSFELTTAPSVLQNGGTTYLSVYVTTSDGGAASNVTAIFSGSSELLGTASTSETGFAGVSFTVDATAGDIVYVTVTIEDKSITAPIQII